jgi:PhnB protein
MALEEQFWGDYFGDVVDKFGVQWMVNCHSKE